MMSGFIRRGYATLLQKQRWGSQLAFPRCFSVSVPTKYGTKQEDEEVKVVVSDSNMKLRMFPSQQRRRGPWKTRTMDGSVPALYEFYPSGLWDALVQSTNSINKLFKDLGLLEPTFRVEEQEEVYKLKYWVPGLGKEDVKIAVEDGVLRIRGGGEREEDDQEGWYFGGESRDTNLVLPEDAKCDGIRAQMKDGILNITIPRTGEAKNDAKALPVH